MATSAKRRAMATAAVVKSTAAAAKPAKVKYGEKHSPDYRAYADAKYGWETAGVVPTSVYVLGGVAMVGLGIWWALK